MALADFSNSSKQMAHVESCWTGTSVPSAVSFHSCHVMGTADDFSCETQGSYFK
ncbi:hypothetical protein H257_08345 [Aphanomyces astaci]|uniref:Uncharacterized protein n=1 Tax=Aphanomyces astaci TaxID=112090 RepID=W4GEQ8_APHAT|nr:hypothetical protein H257_08345 [Aphanomyces astaci]ETV78145.1 hypothetical protein H257_08345 [Aphanomyces astaci]|eukprot:XP_009832482.1 hypothetical protein H257_08345 [Aphanomyces astaci]